MSDQTVKLRVTGDTSGAKTFADDAKAQISGIGDAAQKSASSINATFATAQSRMDSFAKSGGAANRAITDQQGELAKLLGKIDPVTSAYGRLDAQFEALKKFKSSGAISGDDFAHYASTIDKARSSIGGAANATHGLGMESNLAKREVAVLAGELARGNYARFEGSLITLARATGLLGLAFSPIGLLVGGVVAILGVFALAAIKGATESDRLNASVIATGGYAGLTGAAVQEMGRKIGESTGHVGEAREALASLVAGGKLTGDQLQIAARAAVDFSTTTGKSIEDATKAIERIADDPAKAISGLNEQYHFLTLSTYEHIRALEEQGSKTDAATVAYTAFGAAFADRSKQVEDNLGTLERGWNNVKKAAGDAWDRMLNIGRQDSVDTLRANMQAAQEALDTAQANASTPRHYGIGFMDDLVKADNDSRVAIASKQVEDIGAKLAAALDKGIGGASDAVSQAASADATAASDRIDKLTASLDKTRGKQLALNEAAADLYKIYANGGKLPAGINFDGPIADQPQGPGWQRLQSEIGRKFDGAPKKDRSAQDAVELDAAEKALNDTVERLAGGLGEAAKAQADFNIGMGDLEQKAKAAASAGGDVTAIIATWQRGEELLRANLERTNAAIAARGKLASGNVALSAQLQQEKDKLSGLTAATVAYDRAVAQAAKDVVADIARGRDQATVAAELAVRLKTLQDIRDSSEANSLIDQFGKKSEWDELQENIKRTGEAIAKASDPKQLEGLQRAQEKLKTTESQRNDELLGQGVSSLQKFAKEGTAAYTALGIAQDILAYRSAIAAIANQGSGDPYTAFARIAAMIALMASIGIRVAGGGGGGGPSAQSAEVRQAEQGTGSVLGDSSAKSESIARATDITANATTQLVGLNRGMLTALQALQNALGAAGNQLARGAGDVPLPELSGGSTLLDPLGKDPIGGAIGNLLFGGSQKIIDQGIIIAGGALTDMLNGVMVGAYQTIKTKGGLFGGGGTNDVVTDISDEFGKQFQLVIQSIADTVRQGALALGLLPADIEAAMAQYQVEAQRISLEGLSAEDQQKALEAVFSKLFDGLAGAVVPFIGQFQKVGEGLGETLVRVATEVQVTQEAFKQLGLTVDETDPEKFAQISDALVDAAGGLDSFISGMNSFVANFAPAEHQFQVASDALTSAFDQVGLVVPATRDGMWDLMQSLDATTEAGREQIATLLRLSDTADKYYDELEKRADALVQGQVDYAQLLAGVGTGGAGVSSVSPFAAARLQIEKWEQDTIKQASALAKAAGLQGASEKDLTLIHEVAAHKIAQAIIALEESTADLVDQFYGRGQYTEDAANNASSAVSSFGDAMTSAAQAAQSAAQLLLGELSPLNDQQKLQYALGAYQDGLINKEDVLQIGRRLYASSQKYEDLFNLLQTLPGGIRQGDAGGGAADAVAAADHQHQETEAERDQRRHAEAEQISQNIASLSLAQDKSYQDVADTLDVSLGDLSEALGLSQDDLIKYLDNLKAQESAVPDTIVDGTNRIVAAMYDIAGRAPPPDDAHEGSAPPINLGHSSHALPGTDAPTPRPPRGGSSNGDSTGNAPVIERLDRLIIVNDRGHARTAAATTDTAVAVRDVDRSIQRGSGPSTDMRRSNPGNGWAPA